MWDAQTEARRWLDQAENDLGFARLALKEQYFNQVCFISQQAAEKAVKSIAYGLGERRVLGHAIVDLIDRFCDRAPELEELRSSAGSLDLHYVPARYPNGLPGGVPFRTYSEPMAVAAVEAAERIVEAASARVGGSSHASGDHPT